MDSLAIVKDILVLVQCLVEDSSFLALCKKTKLEEGLNTLVDMKEKTANMKWPNVPSDMTLNRLLRLLAVTKGFLGSFKDPRKSSDELEVFEKSIEGTIQSVTGFWQKALVEAANPDEEEDADWWPFDVQMKTLEGFTPETLEIDRNLQGLPVKQIYAGEGKIIGVGTYDGVEVHVKMPNKNLYNSAIVKKALEEFSTEKCMLEAMFHPYIATCLGGLTVDPQSNQPLMWLVYEKFSMNLVDAVNKKVLESEDTRLRIIWGVLQAISYLHVEFRPPEGDKTQPFILGNLKPSDIMLVTDNIPKLFELGRTKVSDKYLRSLTGIPVVIEYMAPEQIKSHQMTTEADIYSFGLVARYVWTGKTPTNEGRPVSKVATSSAAERWMPNRLMDGMPNGISATLHQCIKPDPSNRPDAKQALHKMKFEMGMIKQSIMHGGDVNGQNEMPFWRELNIWKFGDPDTESGSLTSSRVFDDDDDDSGFDDDLYGIKQATIDKLDSIIEQFEQQINEKKLLMDSDELMQLKKTVSSETMKASFNEIIESIKQSGMPDPGLGPGDSEKKLVELCEATFFTKATGAKSKSELARVERDLSSMKDAFSIVLYRSEEESGKDMHLVELHLNGGFTWKFLKEMLVQKLGMKEIHGIKFELMDSSEQYLCRNEDEWMTCVQAILKQPEAMAKAYLMREAPMKAFKVSLPVSTSSQPAFHKKKISYENFYDSPVMYILSSNSQNVQPSKDTKIFVKKREKTAVNFRIRSSTRAKEETSYLYLTETETNIVHTLKIFVKWSEEG